MAKNHNNTMVRIIKSVEYFKEKAKIVEKQKKEKEKEEKQKPKGNK